MNTGKQTDRHYAQINTACPAKSQCCMQCRWINQSSLIQTY